MDSSSEKTDKGPGHIATLHEVDVAAGLDSDKPLDPAAAALLRWVHWTLVNQGLVDQCLSLRKKIDWHLMPLMCSTWSLRPLCDCCRSLLTSGCSHVLVCLDLWWPSRALMLPVVNRMTFADKTTLGQSAVLGIMWGALEIPRTSLSDNNIQTRRTSVAKPIQLARDDLLSQLSSLPGSWTFLHEELHG